MLYRNYNPTSHKYIASLPCSLQGQWKQISRYYVPSRTPTQVASHAQKHFLRISGVTKRRSRFTAVEESILAASIHPPSDNHQAAATTTAATAPYNSASTASGSNHNSRRTPGMQHHVPAATATLFRSILSPHPTAAAAFAVTPYPPPPPDENGVALGIPIAPQLHLAPTPTGKLPMLPVQPGRISAPMMYPATTATAVIDGEITGAVNAHHQHQYHLHSAHRTRQKHGRTHHQGNSAGLHSAVKSRSGGVAKNTLKMVTRKASGKLPSTHFLQTRSTGSRSSTSTTDSSSACYSALDALAGVAAALADSAGT